MHACNLAFIARVAANARRKARSRRNEKGPEKTSGPFCIPYSDGCRVALAQDHFNRRTLDTIRRAGVEVTSVERFALGFFNLIVGRAPRQAT